VTGPELAELAGLTEELAKARVADGGPVPGQARRRLAVVPPGGAA